MKLKMFSKNHCSTSFAAAFGMTAVYTLTAQCLCGRTHFATSDPGCYEMGELDGLLEKQKTDPTRFIEHSDESCVGSSNFFPGRQFVLDCPCNYPSLIESVLWRRKAEIAKFLRTRADAELKLASATQVVAAATADKIGVA